MRIAIGDAVAGMVCVLAVGATVGIVSAARNSLHEWSANQPVQFQPPTGADTATAAVAEIAPAMVVIHQPDGARIGIRLDTITGLGWKPSGDGNTYLTLEQGEGSTLTTWTLDDFDEAALILHQLWVSGNVGPMPVPFYPEVGE